MGTEGQAPELPYAMAKRMRAEGANDAAIIAALMRSGLTNEDAKFAVSSLPGGALDVGAGGVAPPLQTTEPPPKGSFPIMGVTLIVLGLGATGFSYLTAVSGGSYYIWWGMIAVGVVRLLQGR